MADNHDINLADVKASHDGETMLDPDLAMECMAATMSYYVSLRKVVGRKLAHAHKATLKRISEIDPDYKNDDESNVVRLKKYRGLVDHLSELNQVLEEAQIGVEELEQMDEVFQMLPEKIKLYYEHLVSLDQELVELIKEISSAEYQSAYKRAQKIIDMVQDGKNVLSGRKTKDEYADMGIKTVLQPIKERLHDMGNRRKDYSVLPDGKLIRDL